MYETLQIMEYLPYQLVQDFFHQQYYLKCRGLTRKPYIFHPAVPSDRASETLCSSHEKQGPDVPAGTLRKATSATGTARGGHGFSLEIWTSFPDHFVGAEPRMKSYGQALPNQQSFCSPANPNMYGKTHPPNDQ